MLDTNNGFIVKIDSWDYNTLLNDYEICNKIKHVNVMKPFCYFEFEFDILSYLDDNKNHNEMFEDISVIISPYYIHVRDFLTDKSVILQIIYFLYMIFFKHGIGFKKINIDNIYIDVVDRPKNIKYVFNDVSLSVKTKHIVIFDDFCNCSKTMDANFLIPNVKIVSDYLLKDLDIDGKEPMEILTEINYFLD